MNNDARVGVGSSTLTSRLRALVHAGADGPIAGHEERARPASALPGHLKAVLGGDLHEFEQGSCFIVDRAYPTELQYGERTVGHCADVVRRGLAHLWVLAAPGRQVVRAASAQPSMLFFDLETTGLAGGAGTYAFLVGCGRFLEGAFHTRQFFLIGHGAERPLLEAVRSHMMAADVLVSFNGRTFDAPLLETRYLFHRTPVPFAEVPHLDMLHVARRLWQCEAGCALHVLEHALIGVARQGDIPGGEIPARFVQYVRTGDARPLAPVFEHNRLDLLSLAALTASALALVEGGAGGTRTARECLGLGRLYERAGLCDRAVSCYRHAASGNVQGSAQDRAEAWRWLARRMRRERRHDEAADAWQQILALERRDRTTRQAHEAAHALAVHHEHRSHDLAAAHRYAMSASTAAATEADRLQVRHRLARLERKLGLESGPGNRALFADG
jgi:uncharacterized protein